jgi:cyd operon protein YbgT
MWYFTWILGLAFACSFAILNAMWIEMHEKQHGESSDGDHS